HPDIPKPFFVVVNPITHNLHAAYRIIWSEEDTKNIKAAKKRYEQIREGLGFVLGSDPAYSNTGVRSPVFAAGHHRQHPRRRCGYRIIDTLRESIFHRSIWYGSKGFHSLNSLASFIPAALLARPAHQHDALQESSQSSLMFSLDRYRLTKQA